MTENLFGAPGATKPHVVEQVARMAPVAAGAAREVLIAEPRAAPQHLPLAAIVARCPLPNVARHIQQTVGASAVSIGINRRGTTWAGFRVIAAVRIPVVAPGVDAAIGAAGGFLPLGLGGEAVGLAGEFGEPVAVRDGVVPGYVDHGVILLLSGRFPAFPMFRLLVVGGVYEGSVLGVGDRGPGNVVVGLV